MKIYRITTKTGKRLEAVFAYSDFAGELWRNFRDASDSNYNQGAEYTCFVTTIDPDWVCCWEPSKGFFCKRAPSNQMKKEFRERCLKELKDC